MPMPDITYDPSVYAKVTWIGLVSTLDGPDPDEFPDKDALSGSIIFKPSVGLLRFPSAEPQFTLAMTNRQVSLVDAQIDEQGRPYVYLEASSPLSEPANFSWTATFVLAYKGVPVKIPDTKFTVTVGTTIDLTDWIKFDDSVPPVIPPEGNPALEMITGAIQSNTQRIGAVETILNDMDDDMQDFRAIMQGGTAGQVLTQSSSGLPEWLDSLAPSEAQLVPSGGATGQVLTRGASASEWKTPSTPGISITPGGNTTPPTSGENGIAVGYRSSATGSGISLGYWSSATNGAMALGYAVSAGYVFSAGIMGSSTKSSQIMLGTGSHVVTCPNKLEIGSGVAMVTLSTAIEGGKAVLKAQFATGSPVIIATEP